MSLMVGMDALLCAAALPDLVVFGLGRSSLAVRFRFEHWRVSADSAPFLLSISVHLSSGLCSVSPASLPASDVLSWSSVDPGDLREPSSRVFALYAVNPGLTFVPSQRPRWSPSQEGFLSG